MYTKWVVKTGRNANGFSRDGGTIAHVIVLPDGQSPEGSAAKALCGTKPSGISYWGEIHTTYRRCPTCEQKFNKRKAAIAEIVPQRVINDATYAGYVVAKDEYGLTHIFIDGSINRAVKRVPMKGVPGAFRDENVKIGDKGIVEYVVTGSAGLWVWRSK